MDRVTQLRKKGNRLIGNRYMLNSCLFATTLGQLYQARDTQALRQGQEADVLIHFFPPRALGYTTLKTVCERLQQQGNSVEPRLLPILDCGWSGADAFFVMEAPRTWSFGVLPAMGGHRTRLHDKAIQLTGSLMQQGLVREGLQAYLFLVTPEGHLHLPGTILSENLQSLQERNEGLLYPGVEGKAPGHVFPWPAVGLAVAGAAVAGGIGLYYQTNLVSAVRDALPSVPMEQPPDSAQPQAADPMHEPIEAATLAGMDTPAVVSPRRLVSPVLAVPPAPAPPAPVVFSKLDMPAAPPQAAEGELLNSAVQTVPPLDSGAGFLLLDEDVPLPRRGGAGDGDKPDQPPPDGQVPGAGVLGQAAGEKEPADKASKPSQKRVEEAAKPAADKQKTTKTAAREKPAPARQREAKRETKADSPAPAPEPVPVVRSSANVASTEVEPTPMVATLFEHYEPVVLHSSPVPVAPVRVVPPPVLPPPSVVYVRPVPAPAPVRQPRPAPAPVARLVAEPEYYSEEEELTANGMTGDELLKRAYAAIQRGRLDEQANQGAIYFIRLLERIDHGNPQITRLAREVVYQSHQRARNLIQQGDHERASQYLWRAGRVIKEFNLVRLNSAQEVLEHRLVE